MSDTPDTHDPARPKLPRILSSTEALAVIVGSTIGSGIFIVPARVAQQVPAVGPIVLAWIIGGLFSLAGALTLAELGAMLPQAGGPYVYLKHAYGPVPAFLFGWTEFLVIRAGSVATLAAAFALNVAQVWPTPAGLSHEVWLAAWAVGVMVLVAALNIIGTKQSSSVQVIGTALKIAVLAVLVVGPFFLGKAHSENLNPLWPSSFGRAAFGGFMVAMVSVLWTYDGWVNAASMAEEIRDPGRSIPRALTLGLIILMVVYLAITLMYHLVLSLPEMQAIAEKRQVVAAVYCTKLIGSYGGLVIALAIMASVLITLNGNAMSGPRAYFALARDGHFPRVLEHIHPRFQTPANAIVAQAAWSVFLTVAGTAFLVIEPPAASGILPGWLVSAWTTLHKTPLYDVLYTYVIFGGTIIYTLTITSVFVLRWRHPDWKRPYRTWGYPVTPLLYVAASCLLMYSMLSQNLFESIAGLGLILLGLPVYALFFRNRKAELA